MGIVTDQLPAFATPPVSMSSERVTRPQSLVARAMRVLPFSEALCREMASDPDSGLRELVDDAGLLHAVRPDPLSESLAR